MQRRVENTRMECSKQMNKNQCTNRVLSRSAVFRMWVPPIPRTIRHTEAVFFISLRLLFLPHMTYMPPCKERSLAFKIKPCMVKKKTR